MRGVERMEWKGVGCTATVWHTGIFLLKTSTLLVEMPGSELSAHFFQGVAFLEFQYFTCGFIIFSLMFLKVCIHKTADAQLQNLNHQYAFHLPVGVQAHASSSRHSMLSWTSMKAFVVGFPV